MSNRLIPVALAAALTGCYKTNYSTGASTTADPKSDIMHHRLVWGLAELPGPVNVADICPNGVAKIHTERDFVDGILGYFTNYLYAPSTIKVWCKSGKTALITHSQDGMVDMEITEP
jgi:hypothetical protein